MAVSLTADRVRSIIDGAHDEKTVLKRLKQHRIKYISDDFYEEFFLNLYIPCRTGKIRIYRRCARYAPFVVQLVTPIPYYGTVPEVNL